jgi:uncharacterized protein (DUF697 family)
MDNIQKLQKSDEIIRNHTMWASGAGAIPLPLIDIAAVTAVQLDMIRQLSNVYELNYDESAGKHIVTALAGSTLARIGASFVKTIPVIGSVFGGVSMSILSGASTYAMGKVFTNHFANGGNFFNMDFNWAQQFYQQEYQKGETFTKEVTKKEPPKDKKEDSKSDIFRKLEEIVQLKKNGILTEEEFERKKTELLAKI